MVTLNTWICASGEARERESEEVSFRAKDVLTKLTFVRLDGAKPQSFGLSNVSNDIALLALDFRCTGAKSWEFWKGIDTLATAGSS